jgi:hypothetical protein
MTGTFVGGFLARVDSGKANSGKERPITGRRNLLPNGSKS